MTNFATILKKCLWNNLCAIVWILEIQLQEEGEAFWESKCLAKLNLIIRPNCGLNVLFGSPIFEIRAHNNRKSISDIVESTLIYYGLTPLT